MSYKGKRKTQGYGNRPRRGTPNQGFCIKKKIGQKPVTVEFVRETKGFLNIPTGTEKEKMTFSQAPTSFAKEDTASFRVNAGNQAVKAGVRRATGNKTKIEFSREKNEKLERKKNLPKDIDHV